MDRIIEKPVYIEKIIDKPVEKVIERKVEVPFDRYVEVPVERYVDKEVEVINRVQRVRYVDVNRGQ